ncbi:hypothetical protein ACFLXU_04010 [Chloroflexota bacterium]
MSTLLIDKNAVKDLLNMPDVMKAVEDSFRAWAQNEVDMPALIPVTLT